MRLHNERRSNSFINRINYLRIFNSFRTKRIKEVGEEVGEEEKMNEINMMFLSYFLWGMTIISFLTGLFLLMFFIKERRKRK